MTIVMNAAPLANAGNDTAICGNATGIQLNGAVTGGSGMGHWTTSGTGTFTPNDSTLSATYTFGASDITAGTITLTLSSINNGSCTQSVDSIHVTITAPPSVNAGTDIAICNGIMSAQLNGTVSGGVTDGMWTTLGSGTFSPNDSTLNATYNLSTADSTAGSVTLVLTSIHNGSCMAVSDTVKITTNSIANVAAGNDTSICANAGSIQLNGSVTGGSPTGQWTTLGSGTFAPNDSTLNATYSPGASDLTNGSVILVLTATHNCVNKSDSMTITFDSTAVANAGSNQTVCPSAVIALNGSVSGASSGHWSTNGTGTFNPNDSTMNATYTPAGTDNDTLVFVLTASGNSLCGVAKDSITVIRGGQPNAMFYANNACLGGATNFADSTQGTVTAWHWNFGNGDTSNVQNPSYTYTVSGTYTVTEIVSSGGSCSDTIKKTVTVNAAPTASFTFSANCLSDSVHFTDNSSVSPGTINSWSWSFGDGGTSTIKNPQHQYDSIANYTVTLSVVSDSGCTAAATQTLSINPSPLAGFTAQSNCSATVLFTDTSKIGTGTVTAWSWTFGDGGTSAIQNPSYTYNTPGTYTVLLQAQSNNGCKDTASKVVTIGSPVVAQFSPQGGSYNVNQGISFNNQSTGAATYTWIFGDNTTSTATDPSHSFTNAGTYTVILVATNSTGCSDTVRHEFAINSSGYTVPTGFTPNGDNLNDYFYIMGGPFSEYELRVFNEWGQQIFMSNSQADKWDGSFNGFIQPQGTYIYIFNGKLVDGKEVKLHNQINLVR
jgi:gliding motility-associated-like protein